MEDTNLVLGISGVGYTLDSHALVGVFTPTRDVERLIDVAALGFLLEAAEAIIEVEVVLIVTEEVSVEVLVAEAVPIKAVVIVEEVVAEVISVEVFAQVVEAKVVNRNDYEEVFAFDKAVSVIIVVVAKNSASLAASKSWAMAGAAASIITASDTIAASNVIFLILFSLSRFRLRIGVSGRAGTPRRPLV